MAIKSARWCSLPAPTSTRQPPPPQTGPPPQTPTSIPGPACSPLVYWASVPCSGEEVTLVLQAFLRAWDAGSGWAQYVGDISSLPPNGFADPNQDPYCEVFSDDPSLIGCVLTTRSGSDLRLVHRSRHRGDHWLLGRALDRPPAGTHQQQSYGAQHQGLLSRPSRAAPKTTENPVRRRLRGGR